jgi:predicted outer membrane protein
MDMSSSKQLLSATALRAAAAAMLFAVAPGCSSDDDDDQGAGDAIQAAIDDGELRGDQVNIQIEDELAGASDEVVVSTTVAIGGALNEAEIIHAEIALDRSSDPEILDFAEMLIRDHTANIAEAESMLVERGVGPIGSDVADDLAAEADFAADELDATSDANFDRVFLDMQLTMHGQARVIVGEFADIVPDEDMAAFWDDTRATIDGHLDVAVDLASAR